MYDQKIPIAMLTGYDSTFAYLLDHAGVDIILIGDSVGMTVQGRKTTIPVTIEDMIYHTACVAAGNQTACVLADLPFGAYLVDEADAVENCVQLIKAGANMVKFEGGEEVCPLVSHLATMGVPVCGHLGFTPQSINTIGGHYIQGKTEEQKKRLKADALALQNAGAKMLVLEMVPAAVAKELTQELQIPTIGIGAGPDCSGQVLVLQDILGIFPGRAPRFSKNFMNGASSIQEAVANYVKEVKAKTFPTINQSF